MSDLKLVADQPTPLERLLLDAAANESPSAEQRMRVRAALGLAAMTVPPPAVAPAGRAALLGKAAIGGVIAASAIVALMLSGALHRAAPAPKAALVAAPTVAPSPLLAPQAQLAATAEPVVSPLPPVEPASDAASTGTSALRSTAKSVSSVSKTVTSTPAPADSATDLSEQLLLIDAARAAVAAGNSSAASQALSSYGSKFPHGSFGQEAAVLRIETVDLQGNHGQAAALARTFLAQHPNSPHVSLVQRIADRAQ
jgi:hypothetical protein